MTVILEQGSLQGLHFKTRLSNKPYVRFLGIPYARPPIKELRFKVSDCFIINERGIKIIIFLASGKTSWMVWCFKSIFRRKYVYAARCFFDQKNCWK